jgi:salicylate hydroxylase
VVSLKGSILKGYPLADAERQPVSRELFTFFSRSQPRHLDDLATVPGLRGLDMTSDMARTDSENYPWKPLQILVCGAGLAGLGAAIGLSLKGHKVTVLEAASHLSEIGAGIQIPPNSARILEAYSLTETLKAHVAWPRNISIRRYDDNRQLGLTPLHPHLTKQYGYPYWLIHRAYYQRILFDRAIAVGAEVILSARVSSLDQAKPSVTTADGREFEADVVVGADGIRSKIRDFVFPDSCVAPTSIANCAFRATVPVECMMADSETAALMTDVNANAWIGPGRHIMAYPIRQGAMYNLVMCHQGHAEPGEWSVPGDVEEMKATYEDFNPVIRKVIGQVTSCLKWTLADLPPLQTWRSASGKVVLIGDAAHATVPFLAQGASMGIEDGACLSECLSRAKSRDDIPRFLQVFESLRKTRCERIQAGSRSNGEMWHLHDGSEQVSRDHALGAHGMDGDGAQQASTSLENGNPWNNKDFQPWLFGHDVFREAQEALDQM